MTQAPTKTTFPDSSQSPWENPDNGLTYEWNGWGWDIAASDDPADPDEPKPEGLRYRYKAVNYGDFADEAGTIGIGTGPDDGDVDVAPLIALSALNFSAPDLAGSTSPGFSENEHELFICGLDKDTGAEGTFRVELKDGGQRGHRKGFVNANSWYSTPNAINIEVGSEIELIFAPIAKKALEDSGVEVHEGLPDGPYEEGDLYFDTTDDELTLYIYVGSDWVPAAPPVSLDGIQNDIFSLQEVANDVKRQLAYQTVEAQKADTKILDLEEGKVAKAGDEISGALKIESPVTEEQPALTVEGTSASSDGADIFKVKGSDGRTKFWVDEAGRAGGDSNYRGIAKTSSHFVNVRTLKKYLYAPARMEYIVRINKDLAKLNGGSATSSIWMDNDHFAKGATLIMDGTTCDYICSFKDDVKSGESKKIISSSSSPNTPMLISAWENTDDGGWEWIGTSQVKTMHQKHGHFEIVIGSSEYSKKFTDYGHYFFTISGFF